MRWMTGLLGIAAMLWPPLAQACSCIRFKSQAEADATGERIIRDADLIVEATLGDVPAKTRRLCSQGKDAAGERPVGKILDADKALTIHRVLKGTPGPQPRLAQPEMTVRAGGCSFVFNSCEIGFPRDERVLLVLRRVAVGRYAALDVCSMQALRQSKAGQALFERIGERIDPQRRSVVGG